MLPIISCRFELLFLLQKVLFIKTFNCRLIPVCTTEKPYNICKSLASLLSFAPECANSTTSRNAGSRLIIINASTSLTSLANAFLEERSRRFSFLALIDKTRLLRFKARPFEFKKSGAFGKSTSLNRAQEERPGQRMDYADSFLLRFKYLFAFLSLSRRSLNN